MDRLSLIDISTADDLLVPSPGEGSMPESFSGLFEDLVEENCFQKQSFQLPESPLSPEQNQNHRGRYNMRKSLAWDNAFFTSEGVLNHEELAKVNSSFKKTESSSLPIILEDLARSADSISSSDDASLENLEVDLFHNVPSVQKSRGTTERANKLAHPSKKSILAKEASIRTESATRNKNKSSMALERSGACSHHREAISRGITVANASDAGISSCKRLPYPQRAQTPSIVLNKKNSIPGNAQIIRTTNTKDKPGNVGTQKSVVAPRRIKINGGPCNGTVKSPSLTPNSGSNSLDAATTSRLKITSAAEAINHPSSEPITRRTSMKTSRTVARNHSVSPNSSVNFSSTTPTSSFDSITSGSSSSTIFGVKTLMDALDGCSPSSTFSEGSDLDKIHSPEDNTADQQSRVTHPRSFNSNSSRPKCSKPSGLRVPTPKLGYF